LKDTDDKSLAYIYAEVYQDPRYKLGKARQEQAWKDIDAMAPGVTYLDVGCGRGETVEYALSRGIIARGTELCRPLCNENVLHCSVRDLPLSADEFQFVSCYDVLEHLPEHAVDGALDNLWRVCSSTLLITTNMLHSYWRNLELHLTRQPREWWEEKFEARGGHREFTEYTKGQWHWWIDL
jgi:2-polyprenyl-3-methyl-5-hydroxy-6-metoxy-1,4-benzoquinol methylase